MRELRTRGAGASTLRSALGAWAILLAMAAVAPDADASAPAAAGADAAHAPAPAPAGPVAITGGRLLTISHGVIEDGVLVLRDGRIAAVGAAGEVAVPADARVVDARGMTVYPGLIDSDTSLGLAEMDMDFADNDVAESSQQIFPQARTADAFDAESPHIPVVRLNGITNAVAAPGDLTSLPGRSAFIQLHGRDRDEMIQRPELALHLFLSERVRRAGGQFPGTRMGVVAQLRQTLIDARAYLDQRGKGGARDLKFEALAPYLEGRRPVVISATESQDVAAALELAREFGLEPILGDLVHAGDQLDRVAASGAPVIVGPIHLLPRANERYDAVFRLPAELHRRGVKIAFGSGGVNFIQRFGYPRFAQTRNLPYLAGLAVAYGLPYEEALKALTLNPAQIWGVDDELGSLDAGKLANVVIATGDPLEMTTDVRQVFIRGVAVPMESYQTQLRDAYQAR